MTEEAKPATDERIDAARIEMGAPHYTARLAAEARVKVLGDAAQAVIDQASEERKESKRASGWAYDHVYCRLCTAAKSTAHPEAHHPNCAILKLQAALKEPANG